MKVSSTQIPTYTNKLYRTGVSSYQASDFTEKEKLALNSIGIEYCQSIDRANILVTNTHTKLNQDHLNHLQLIIHPNSGYDNFDPTMIQSLKAPVILGNEIRSKAVATYILSCFYHAFSNPPFSNSWDKNRSWPRRSLDSLSVQIFGYGHIAKILENSLSPIVKRINFYDPYQNKNEFDTKADCFIMACSLNKFNEQMINHDFLTKLNFDCVFINAARGRLVKINHLCEWLKASPRAKAYLDVFESEPYDFSSLPQNAFATSHLAGVDSLLDERIIAFVKNVSSDWIKLDQPSFDKKWKHLYLNERIKNNQFI